MSGIRVEGVSGWADQVGRTSAPVSDVGKLERLVMDERISEATREALGFTAGENLRAKIRAVYDRQRSAQDGVAMIQIASGAVVRLEETLHRMHDLAARASSDQLTSGERRSIDAELQSLSFEVAAVSSRTTFAGRAVWPQRVGGDENVLARVGKSLDDFHRALDPAGARDLSAALEETLGRLGETRDRLEHEQAGLDARIESAALQVGAWAGVGEPIRDQDRAAALSANTLDLLYRSPETAVAAQASGLPEAAALLVGEQPNWD